MKEKQKKTTQEVTDSICQMVADKLVAMMEQGVNPWRKPWVGATEQQAVSHTNGKPYSLLNQILLGFRSGEYLTFNQVKAEGGSVKKGAKSEIIVFWQGGQMIKATAKPKEDEAKDETSEEKEVWVEWRAPILKYYRVFHIDDCEGIKPKFAEEAKDETFDFNPIERAEEAAQEYCNRSGVKLVIQKNNSACYRPSCDTVIMPLREQFESEPEFYSTLFHELTHSTGHEARLNRFKTGVYAAKENYSREELVAEIGSATALAHLGINNEASDANSAAYLQGWIKFIKSDPKAIVVAAGRAEKAHNLIFGN